MTNPGGQGIASKVGEAHSPFACEVPRSKPLNLIISRSTQQSRYLLIKSYQICFCVADILQYFTSYIIYIYIYIYVYILHIIHQFPLQFSHYTFPPSFSRYDDAPMLLASGFIWNDGAGGTLREHDGREVGQKSAQMAVGQNQ